MRELLLVTLVIGVFSGVDVERLMETPILGTEPVIEVVGDALAEHGGGMRIVERDGRMVALTVEQDFFLEFTHHFEPGSYALVVEASAPDRASDSYWIVLNGEQLIAPIVPPIGAMAERAGGFRIEEAGEHTVRLTLRERPGSEIALVRIRRNLVQPPREPMLPELAAQRPRMFLTSAEIPAMRERLDDETVRQYYEPAGVLTRQPPAFNPLGRNGGPFRALPGFALSHLLDPDPAKLAAIIDWLEMATTYPHCGVDLDAAYFMEGVTLSYDWLYHELPEDLRERVRETIARQARVLYEASLAGITGGALNFQQNHYWFAHLALIMAGAALYGELPEAHDWLGWGWDRAERIFITFSPDGGFHEGPAYWDFSMPTLYLLVDLYEQLSGVDVPWTDTGLAGQAAFRLHHVFPGMEESAALEDSRYPEGLPPVRLLHWEAKRYQDSVAQGIAETLNRGASSHAFALLWLDETIEPADPFVEVPRAQYYEDIETVFARTSWDHDATFVALVSRPLGGHLYAELCDLYGLSGTGHNHPAQGHFVLFGRGEVLAHDPGYTYEKKTSNHNTVIIDGQGQYGDGEMWPSPKPGRATITGFVSEGDLTIIAADPSSAYPAELGVERFDRIFALAGPDLAVVYDRLETSQPRSFSWLLQHIGDVQEVGGGWIINRGQAQFAVLPLEPDEFEAVSERHLPDYVHATRDLTPRENAEVGRLSLTTAAVTEATFLVPMLIGAAGSELSQIERISGEGYEGVRVGGTLVVFNRDYAQITVEMPWGETVTTRARALVGRDRRITELE